MKWLKLCCPKRYEYPINSCAKHFPKNIILESNLPKLRDTSVLGLLAE